ncbi:hypothetical protein [Amycolatopsis sp. NBC_01480]|uniref:hypothetical protein n=1 Tax=Amycolatopsis sp. NBC_01480 TaxID=2903562 RepID=UPI002E2A7D93|nr:hypothetical protein [Amycolatopsis sp. NBC_01480]
MRAAGEVAVWWFGLAALWLVTLSTPALPELLAGAVAALTAAVAAVAARHALGGRWRPKRSWWRWVAALPVAAVRESALALRTVFRDPTAGGFEEVALPDEPGPVREARLAAAALVLGCTPGTMVVSGGSRVLLVHRLPGSGTRALRQVSR